MHKALTECNNALPRLACVLECVFEIAACEFVCMHTSSVCVAASDLTFHHSVNGQKSIRARVTLFPLKHL